MAFEEYQFLRYFIPGSLFVIYVTLLVLPNLNPQLFPYLSSNPETILAIVAGAFGASLAFGYLIYSFYDLVFYNFLAMKFPNKRKILGYMKEKIEGWDDVSEPDKKEFLDMLYRLPGDANKNEQVSSLTRGIWSHFNARIVSATCVPLFAGISVFTLYEINNKALPYLIQMAKDHNWTLTSPEIFRFNHFFVWVWVVLALFISLFLA